MTQILYQDCVAHQLIRSSAVSWMHCFVITSSSHRFAPHLTAIIFHPKTQHLQRIFNDKPGWGICIGLEACSSATRHTTFVIVFDAFAYYNAPLTIFDTHRDDP